MAKKRILIVEDERIIAEDIRRTLINFGYHVIDIVSSGEEAIRVSLAQIPDLVLMDIMLEGELDGIEAATQIRNKVGAPVIYLTAYANEITLQSAKITEPFGYIIKPFEERELHATIEMTFYRHKIEKAIQLKTRQQDQLLESARHLTSSLDVEQVLEHIGNGAKKIMKAHSCVIYFLEDDESLRPVIVIDPDYKDTILQTIIPIDNSFTGQAVKAKKALFFNESFGKDTGLHVPGTSELKDERIIVAPFMVDNKVIGAMCLSRIGEIFTNDDIALAEGFATYASTALKNAQTYMDLQKEMEERKVAETMLHETQFRLTSIFKNVPSIILYEKFGGREFISDNIKHLIGISARQYIQGKVRIEDRMHPEDKPIILSKFHEWYESDDKSLLNLWYRLKNARGDYIWIEDRVVKVTDANNSYVSGVMIDNTNLKAAEEALKQSQLRYKAVVEDQSELIIRYNNKGILTFVNEAYCRYYRKDPESLIGYDWYEIQTAAQSDQARIHIAKLKTPSQSTAYEQEEIIDGKSSWIEWTHRAIFDENGLIIEYQAFGRNITDNKQAEEEKENIQQQLIQSQKMEVVGRLAGGIAHDFNNLLTAINGYTDLILKRISAKNENRKDLEVIQSCGTRASDLTKQLLAFSRKQIIQPRFLDLNYIITDMDKMLRRLIGENLDYITVVDENLPTIKADKSQIESVVTNLVVNAKDALEENGKIIVKTEKVVFDKEIDAIDKKIKPGIYSRLSVMDNGSGMTEEVKKHLFEPFFTTKEQGKGTGLGLATVFGIIDQAKGYIRVNSTLGQGSNFCVFFPAYDHKAAITMDKESVDDLPTGTETILLTEDEESIREYVNDILTEFGYTVLEAASGEEAIALARDHPDNIHLLFTDVVMPYMNGQQLMEKVKVIHPEIKILFMSGYTESVAIQKCVLELKMGFLQKPFSSVELINKIREILDS